MATNIMLAVPSYTGMIPLKVMSRLICLDKPKDANVNFSYVSRCLIDKARNGMVQQCLMHNNDYLFFVDDDQIPDKDILIKMIALDKDIVGCPIPSRSGLKELAVYDLNGNRLNEFMETQEVGAVGMGSTLIKRHVLEKVVEKWGAPFQFEVREENDILVEYSEDINFCARARSLGLQVWCMADVASRHIGNPVEYYYEKEYKIS